MSASRSINLKGRPVMSSITMASMLDIIISYVSEPLMKLAQMLLKLMPHFDSKVLRIPSAKEYTALIVGMTQMSSVISSENICF